jgi:hypothetical protein
MWVVSTKVGDLPEYIVGIFDDRDKLKAALKDFFIENGDDEGLIVNNLDKVDIDKYTSTSSNQEFDIINDILLTNKIDEVIDDGQYDFNSNLGPLVYNQSHTILIRRFPINPSYLRDTNW